MSKLTKKFRVTLDFTVEVDEAIGNNHGRSQKYLDLQQRFLTAVISHPHVLNTYLHYLIASELTRVGWGEWYKILIGTTEDNLDEMLSPAIATLPKRDQRWFADLDDAFYENIEPFEGSFSVSRDSIILVEREP